MSIKGISDDIDFSYLMQIYVDMKQLYQDRINRKNLTPYNLDLLAQDDNDVKQAWERYQQNFEDFFTSIEEKHGELGDAVNATKSIDFIKSIVLKYIKQQIKAEMTNAQIAMDLAENRRYVESKLKSLIDFEKPYLMEIEDIGNTNDVVRQKWDSYHTLVTNFIRDLKTISTELEDAIDPRVE